MSQNQSRTVRRMHMFQNPRLALAAAAGLSAIFAGGCHWDTFMDPSKPSRFENTPTRVPILSNIASIEDGDGAYVEFSEITAEDLQPRADEYRLAAGDSLRITIYDLIDDQRPELLDRQVDPSGYVEIPTLGRVPVLGLTEDEATERIARRLEGIIDNPTISVNVVSRREQTFTLIGNVEAPGPYFVPSPDFRLLEALSGAGGFPEFVKEIYVIRQVPLTLDPPSNNNRGRADRPQGAQSGPANNTSTNTNTEQSGDELLELIDQLSEPAVFGSSNGAPAVMPTSRRTPATMSASASEMMPQVELIDDYGANATAASTAAQPVGGEGGNGMRWMFVNGEWVLAAPAAAIPPTRGPSTTEPDPMSETAGLVTQRVIRVPVKPLVAGDARYNIVVRPGDIIRVPTADIGNYYMDGEIARPGAYSLPGTDKLTLKQAVSAAGGLGSLAIPERVDLTRRLPNDTEATIMLDYRAISEGTQPDIFIKPSDRIFIGTNFWATPLAVIRNGFRASYGFGFLLDRNFGNDVFGAPPTNNRGF